MTADSDALKKLLDIQDRDRSVDALRHQRGTLAAFEHLGSAQAAMVTLDDDSVAVTKQRHQLERTQKRLEDEVAMLVDRSEVETAKLYGGDAGGVKELQALQDELAGLKARQILVEDQILEVMEEAEPVDAELAVFAERREALEKSAAAAQQAIVDEQAAIDGQLAELEAGRRDAAAQLDPTLVAEYERIRSQPGKVGVAKLAGSTCRGCHLELSAMEVDRLKKLPADELIHCDECGCILVR